jgi:hypothetical protein
MSRRRSPAPRFSRWKDAPAWASDQPCRYQRHRRTDWQLRAGGPVVCGVCHPPAPGLDVEDVRP